jgi:hypothetical protein
VVYRPIPKGQAVVLLLMAIAFLVLAGSSLVAATATVTLHCARAAAACTLVSAVGPFTSEKSIPLDSIQGTKVNAVRRKRGPGYELALRTTHGDVRLTSASWDKTLREDQQGKIDGFLGDPDAPSLDLECDHAGSMGGVVLMLIPIALVALGCTFLAHGRVEIDWEDQTVRIMRVRWPLPTRVRSFPLVAVRAAKVMIRPPSYLTKQRESYTVDVQVDGEPKSIALASYHGVGPLRQQEIAARINALLGER